MVPGGPFTDTWIQTNPGVAGNTWPLQLEDPVAPSTPNERIDLVLERGATSLTDTLVGNTTADPTLPGLWPSDHAGGLATLALG